MKHGKSGVLAAVLASSCCVLPLLLLAAGLGGSLLTVVLAQYKAYLMTFAVAALGLTWVNYVRDTKRCAAEVCELIGGRFRTWMLRINTVVVAFFLLTSYTPAGSLASSVLQGSPDLVQPSTVRATVATPAAKRLVTSVTTSAEVGTQRQLEKVSLRVEGMS